jgi:hypothetical protein
VDVAKPGDVVIVHAGTYAGIHFQQSGASGSPIVVRSFPGERPVMQGGSYPVLLEAEPWQNGLPVGWIAVDGFELRSGTVGIEITNAHDLALCHNFIHDNSGQGILGYGHDVLIEGNAISKNGDFTTNHDHGMYLTGRRFTITNNVVWGNSAYGLQIAAYNCNPPPSGFCAGTDFSGAVDWLVANNTIALEQLRGGIVVWKPGASYGAEGNGELSNVRIVNNVFFDNNRSNPGSTNGVDIDYEDGPTQGDSTIVIATNLFFSDQGNVPVNPTPNAAAVSDVVQADPFLVAPQSADFHLLAGSPAIDRGVTVPQVTVDFDGTPRPQGPRYDLGAYEYH